MHRISLLQRRLSRRPRHHWASGLLAGLALMACAGTAQAVPAFARQTGQNCIACHVSFPELTPYGRFFKLNGYTIGTRQAIPLAVMAQVGYSALRKPGDEAGADAQVADRSVRLSAASLFAAGKLSDNIGAFTQFTYDNLNDTGDGSTDGHSGIDNVDIRAVARWETADGNDVKVLAGLTLHNNPTVQDVWNSTPAWSFPYTNSPNQVTPSAATQIEGALAQQVAGLGAYLLLDRSWYGELSFYRTADGPFSLLRAGQDSSSPGGVARLDGWNPYLRLAWTHESGPHSMMVGAYGLRLDRYPDNTLPGTATDRYTDLAVDAQYQYITAEHTVTLQASDIRERQDYRASYPATLAGNPIGAGPTPLQPVDHLTTRRVRAAYQYQRTYGASLALFDTRGDSDAGLYAPASVSGSANGSPESRGYLLELIYNPIQNMHLIAQYTGYSRFNGGDLNYDGQGRNASDNNTLFLDVWFVY